MRLPVRSEPDAFLLTCAFAVLVGVSVLIGYLTSPLAGIIVFVVVALGALAWDFFSGEPSPRLRDAQQEGHERAADGPHRILVVAGEPLSGDELRDEILRRGDGGGRPVLEVLAPVLESRSHFVTTDIDQEREAARERLRETLAWAHDHGLRAHGEVGDPIDPLAGLQDELRRYDIDEVLFVTGQSEQESWIEAGLLERTRRELEIPVSHVVIDRESHQVLIDGKARQEG